MRAVMKNIPLFIRKDIVLIAVLLLIAGAIGLFAGSSDGQTATVTCDGETVTVIDLKTAENETFTAGNTVIEVRDGTIGFIDSDCGDKTCVRTGSLKNSGDAAACVPNKVAIMISGEKTDSDIDIMAY